MLGPAWTAHADLPSLSYGHLVGDSARPAPRGRRVSELGPAGRGHLDSPEMLEIRALRGSAPGRAQTCFRDFRSPDRVVAPGAPRAAFMKTRYSGLIAVASYERMTRWASLVARSATPMDGGARSGHDRVRRARGARRLSARLVRPREASSPRLYRQWSRWRCGR